MIHIPELSDPNFQAFIAGFFLPFIAAAMGFAVYVVRKYLSNVDKP